MTKDNMKNLLIETPLLDYRSPNIQTLITQKDWQKLPLYERIGAVYHFVKDEIRFGYNKQDALPASQILNDGHGQCNTKGILLMALFRAVGIPCRLHGFTIKKSLQRGVVPELIYPITPDNIVHSWVEIFYEGKWINLEGFILDVDFLAALQEKFKDTKSLCAYGAGTETLDRPDVNWRGADTYIQKTGINNDHGIFNNPDDFFAVHEQSLSPIKTALYKFVIRHWMNARVKKLRGAV